MKKSHFVLDEQPVCSIFQKNCFSFGTNGTGQVKQIRNLFWSEVALVPQVLTCFAETHERRRAFWNAASSRRFATATDWSVARHRARSAGVGMRNYQRRFAQRDVPRQVASPESGENSPHSKARLAPSVPSPNPHISRFKPPAPAFA